jgi:hypothetical protein
VGSVQAAFKPLRMLLTATGVEIIGVLARDVGT